MDLIKLAKKIILKNLKLTIVLVLLAVVSSIVHFKTQTLTYTSNFKTSNGFLDYSLFKSLIDFKMLNIEEYDMREEELDKITNHLENFKISYIEETVSSYSFTLSTTDSTEDHEYIQNSIIQLMNKNKFVKKAQANEIEIMERKLVFLKEKIRQLDSLMLSPLNNARISDIPRDSYDLFSDQLDIEDKLKATGNYYIIKPIIEVKTNHRPFIIFLGLYFILAGFIFLIFSKKV
jgi:hypothetical protein